MLPTFDVPVSEMLLNWRKLVCQTKLSGLSRQLAAGSAPSELSDRHVILRPRLRRLVSEAAVADIEREISRALGHDFHVTFTDEEIDEQTPTVALIEESERRKLRVAMIEAFKSDPFVQQCVRLAGGVVDDTSVRLLTETELKELENYGRKHPGLTRTGSENAEKR